MTACTHLNIVHTQRHHEGGTCSDAWACRDCGARFAPAKPSTESNSSREAEIEELRAAERSLSAVRRFLRMATRPVQHPDDPEVTDAITGLTPEDDELICAYAAAWVAQCRATEDERDKAHEALAALTPKES